MTGCMMFLIGSLIVAAIAPFSGRWRVISVNLCAVFLGLALFEGYLSYTDVRDDGTRMDGSITGGFTHPDDLLGYAPGAGARFTARKFYNQEMIYDVAYTIDDRGLRISPPSKEVVRGCIVFFGDSITFGEGVDDEQTMPFQVGKKTNGEYKIVNMAFSGYGPHQMLALLQADRVRQTADCSISHFIYLCIPEHVERVGGVAFWDKHGPRFTLASNGAVVRDGNFDSVAGETGAFALKSMGRHLHDTFLMAQLISRSMRRSEQDLALMTAVICEAARLSREQQPKSEFHVILWDGAETERVVEIERELRASGIPVHRITEAISDFRTNSRDYVLNKYDLHPNPRQHEMIANYIVSHILQKDQRSGDSERSSH